MKNEELPKTILPTAKVGDGRRSGEMAKAALDQRAAVEYFEELANPEERWTEDTAREANHGRLFLLGMASLTIVGLIVAGLYYTRSQAPPAGARQPAHQLQEEKVPDQDLAPVNQFSETASAGEILESVEKTIRSFLKTDSLENRTQFLIGGEKVLPKMRKYYSRHPERLNQIIRTIERPIPIALDGVPLYGVSVHLEGDSEPQLFSLLPGDDQMLIEWESSVAYGELSWTEFTEKRPASPLTMRVKLSNRKWNDPEKPEEGFYLFVKDDPAPKPLFVPANSTAAHSLSQTKLSSDGSSPFTVKLRWNRKRELPELVEINHPYWVDFERYHRLFPE